MDELLFDQQNSHHQREIKRLSVLPIDAEEVLERKEDVGERESGVYEAVAVAAFGGVIQQMTGKTQSVHPLLVAILALPLFMFQMSCVVLMRMDTDMGVTIYNSTEWRDLVQGTTSRRDLGGEAESVVVGMLLLKAKLFMCVVLQLMFFSKLQNAVRLLVFLMNPTTWTDIKRIDKGRVKFRGCPSPVLSALYNPILLAPVAVGAMLLKIITNYIIIVDSISVILASTRVKSAIFDSLAVAFIAEMPIVWYQFVSIAFHFTPISNFNFVSLLDAAPLLEAEEKRREAGVRQESDSDLLCAQENGNLAAAAQAGDPRAVMLTRHKEMLKKHRDNNVWWSYVEKPTRKYNFSCICRRMHRGKGSLRIEWVLSAAVLFVIYARQYSVLIHGLHTNVLPVARDVCTFYRWQTGTQVEGEGSHMTTTVFSTLEHFLFINCKPVIEERGKRHCLHSADPGDKFSRIKLSAIFDLFSQYPPIMYGGMAFIAFFTLIPQIFFAMNEQISGALFDDEKKNVD